MEDCTLIQKVGEARKVSENKSSKIKSSRYTLDPETKNQHSQFT